MAIEADNLTPKVLQVTIAPPPVGFDPHAIRLIFADLARYGYDTFAPTPDGGAVMSNPRLQKQTFIGQSGRGTVLQVETTIQRAVEELIDSLRTIEQRLPVPEYMLFQASITSHLPVSGETAAALLQRKVFHSEAFSILGGGQLGTGFKVFLAGGQSYVVVEPLLENPGRLFVQYLVVHPLQFQLNAVNGMLGTMTRYQDSQVKEFIGRLLGAD